MSGGLTNGEHYSTPVLGHSASRAVHVYGIDVLGTAIRADGISGFHAEFSGARLGIGFGVEKKA